MALTQDRNTPELAPNLGLFRRLPVAASVIIYAGALVALNSDGFVIPGKTQVGLKSLGRAEELVDNSAGENGDATVLVKTGIFKYENSADADEILLKDIGNDCYIVDDETVAKTDGDTGSGPTRSVAGKVFDVEEDGVWVIFS